MEKIGLINDIARNLDVGWIGDKDLEASLAMQKRNATLSERLILLKEVKAAKDINVALGVEEMLLRQELTRYANSPEQRNSISTAIQQLQEAKQSLSVVQDHKGYQAATATYSGKKKEGGLPLDSFREFLKSHNTRLTNRMTSPLSMPDKSILRQRKEILGIVKEVYIGMQRKALGMEAPNKSRSLGR